MYFNGFNVTDWGPSASAHLDVNIPLAGADAGSDFNDIFTPQNRFTLARVDLRVYFHTIPNSPRSIDIFNT